MWHCSDTFFTFLAGHRSSLRASVAQILGRAHGLISPDNLGTAALPVAIDFTCQEAKRIVSGEEVIEMDSKENLEQVDGYEVPIDPMDDLECDSCQ